MTTKTYKKSSKKKLLNVEQKLQIAQLTKEHKELYLKIKLIERTKTWSENELFSYHCLIHCVKLYTVNFLFQPQYLPLAYHQQ